MSPDCDSETTLVAATPDMQARVAARIREAIGPCPQPILSGYRLVSPGRSEIFLVDPAGYRRRVPTHTVYSRLFRSWRGIVDTHDIEDIAERAPIGSGTILLRGDAADTIYLLDDGRKRKLTSDAVMDRYWFNWGRVGVVRQLLIEHMPAGDDWE